MALKTPCTEFESKNDFVCDLIEFCNRFFSFRCERNLGGSYVHEEDCRSVRDSFSPSLLKSVSSPVDVGDCLCNGTGTGLIEQRYAVGESEDSDLSVRRNISSVNDSCLYEEWIAVD